MEIIKENDKESIYIYGGYNWTSINNLNIQNHLDDLWKYNIEENIWIQIFHISNENPQARYGASIQWIDSRKFILFGGINSSGVLNDLWMFNIYTNKWTNIKSINTSEHDWPYPAKFSTLIKYSSVIHKINYIGNLIIWRVFSCQWYYRK